MEHRNISIADQIFEGLEHDILVSKYSRGEILTESGLSETLGVSRTPIREALCRLEQEHLVEFIPKGIKVIGISPEDMAIIFEMRIRIEGMAARIAAERATEEQIKKMNECIDLQDFYCHKSDFENIIEMDGDFHRTMYEMTGLTPLYQILYELHKKTMKYRRASVQKQSRAALSVKEHRDIYEAIAAHDANRAEQLTILHIKNARDNILNNK